LDSLQAQNKNFLVFFARFVIGGAEGTNQAAVVTSSPRTAASSQMRAFDPAQDVGLHEAVSLTKMPVTCP
jgi:hypothetical protein